MSRTVLARQPDKDPVMHSGTTADKSLSEKRCCCRSSQAGGLLRAANFSRLGLLAQIMSGLAMTVAETPPEDYPASSQFG
ncbi:hypothetical protein KL949_005229 [Ogataea haglerorum]|nr:hypothetical protein KL949_005229 [Ogataea haglerorum]KAG7733418.1 hypothetical protein KL932_005199 [Ogataea haglerorum]KAG7773910.1 hypothetical protein KL922_005082 [Ogataea haglerorum]